MSSFDVQSAESLREEISHQIETKRHYENLSWQLIRLLLTIIGFLLTTLSILASIVISRGLSILPDFRELIDPKKVVGSLVTEGGLGDFTAGILVTILSFTLIILFILTLHDLFIGSLGYAFKLQRPGRLSYGLSDTENLKKLDIQDLDNRTLNSRVSEAFDHNQEIVRETRENWNQCLDYLQRGTYAFTVAFILIGPSLVLSNPLIVVFVATLVGLTLLSYLTKQSRYESLLKYELRRISTPMTGIGLGLVILSAVLSQNYLTLSELTLLFTIYIYSPIFLILAAIESLGHERESNSGFATGNLVSFGFLLFTGICITMAASISSYNSKFYHIVIMVCSFIFLIPVFGILVGDMYNSLISRIQSKMDKTLYNIWRNIVKEP